MSEMRANWVTIREGSNPREPAAEKRTGLPKNKRASLGLGKIGVKKAARKESRPDWRNDADCVGVDPEIFFPTSPSGIQAAKDICMRCVVIGDCLKTALDTGEEHGIWGGMSATERSKVLRRGRR